MRFSYAIHRLHAKSKKSTMHFVENYSSTETKLPSYENGNPIHLIIRFLPSSQNFRSRQQGFLATALLINVNPCEIVVQDLNNGNKTSGP